MIDANKIETLWTVRELKDIIEKKSDAKLEFYCLYRGFVS